MILGLLVPEGFVISPALHHLKRRRNYAGEDGIQRVVEDTKAGLAQLHGRADSPQGRWKQVNCYAAPDLHPVPVGRVEVPTGGLNKAVDPHPHSAHVEEHVEEHVAQHAQQATHPLHHLLPEIHRLRDDPLPVASEIRDQTQAVDDYVEGVEEHVCQRVGDLPARLERDVHGSHRRRGAAAHDRSVVLYNGAGAIRAGGGSYALVEMGDGAVNELPVAHVPGGRLVEEGLQHAGWGPAGQTVGLSHQCLRLGHGRAEVLQVGVDQTDVY